jgi:SAM-dependent methyltransferase
MPLPSDAELRRLARYSGDPWVPENPYFVRAEGFMADCWEKLVYPFVHDCDFRQTLDLAAGHGRNCPYLLRHACQLHVMDIQEGNIEICRQRLSAFDNVRCYVNTGYDLQPIADGDLTFIYCFDAMVHFEPEVISAYLAEARRVLGTGGRGFFHHSNYTGGMDWRANPAARNFMSQDRFAKLSIAAGLRIIRQQVIDWDGHAGLDCLSLVERGE